MVFARTGRGGRFVRALLVLLVALCASGTAGGTAGATPAPDPGISAYIVGGKPVAPHEHPSLAAILVDIPGAPVRDRLVCTGTVVSSRWILTAGHCSFNVLFDTPLLVQVGSRDLGGASAQTVAVDRATVHKTYFNKGNAYDIALLHTAAPLNAPAADLATSANNALVGGGRLATAVGWGFTKQLGIQESPRPSAKPPRRARAVEIPIVNDAACASTYKDYAPGYFVPVSDLCAGVAGKNVCYGDSGGPLFAKDAQGTLIEIGVTSRGAGCATKLFPAIFTDVRRFHGWINRWSTHDCQHRVTFPDDPDFPAGPLFVC